MSDIYKNLWLCMDALAAALECDHGDAEKTLDQLEAELEHLSEAERGNVRRKMICIVAQLSRLEVRMMATHGPLRPPI
jgi:hypothetical protein